MLRFAVRLLLAGVADACNVKQANVMLSNIMPLKLFVHYHFQMLYYLI